MFLFAAYWLRLRRDSAFHDLGAAYLGKFIAIARAMQRCRITDLCTYNRFLFS